MLKLEVDLILSSSIAEVVTCKEIPFFPNFLKLHIKVRGYFPKLVVCLISRLSFGDASYDSNIKPGDLVSLLSRLSWKSYRQLITYFQYNAGASLP